MGRYTTFALDLALIGGQDERSSRSLPWDEFVAHWSERATPLPLQPRWSTHAKKMVWRKAWRPPAPEEWNTATWPDFNFASRTSKSQEEATRTPLTILHMALVDWMDGCRGAQEAFGFLLSCGLDSNVWPGHGGSVIATACGAGHLPSLLTMLSHGHDFQATLGPDTPSRPEFRGSCLLHRVGKALAQKSQRKGAGMATTAVSARRTLEFLVEHMPDPVAIDAHGRPALEVVLDAAPSLSSVLTPIWLKRTQQRMAMSLGYDPDLTPDLAPVADENKAWAMKGKAQSGGEPMAFLAPNGFSWGQGPVAPFPLEPLAPGQARPDALVLRADKVIRSREDLDGEGALALAREEGAEAVVCRAAGEEVWWAFHPRQVRPALLPTPIPSPRPSSPRF